MALSLSNPCVRPGIGKQGKALNVVSNFYQVTFKSITIHQYDIKFSPELDKRDWDKARPIWQKFEEQFLPVACAVFDGRSLVFSSQPLPFGPSCRETIVLRETPRGREAYEVALVKTKLQSSLQLLQDYLNQKIPSGADIITMMQAMNVLFHEKNDPTFLRIQEKFYKDDVYDRLSGGLEVFKGIFQSFRCGPGRALLNVDTAVAVMHERCDLINLCVKHLGLRDVSELGRLDDRLHRKVVRLLKSLRVVVTHRGERGRRSDTRIRDVTRKAACDITFTANEDNSEKPTTTENVAAYFEKRWNIRLKYPKLPCVDFGKKGQVPMEVCELVPGQKYSKKLNPVQTAEMIKVTCIKPAERLKLIEKGVASFQFGENRYLKEWGVSVASKPLQIKARQLPSPRIEYAQSQTVDARQPGVWDARGKKLCITATLAAWSIVSFTNKRRLDDKAIRTFSQSLIRGCVDVGMDIKNRMPPLSFGNPDADVEKVLKQAWIAAGNQVKSQPELVVVIVPAVEPSLYGEIKRVMNTVIGCPSQVLVSTKLTNPKGVGQYCGNVALKLNAKLGGANTFLPSAAIQFVSSKPTCIIGADVNHPGKGEEHVPSFSAVVGSIDAKATRYASTGRAQAGRQEIIEDMGPMVKEILQKFYSTSKQKPQRLLIYRDGISEGHSLQVLEAEVGAIKDSCRELEPTYEPLITFISCQKRHHTRIFPVGHNADRSGNCHAGTVVDSEIVHPEHYDFYILSHAGLQGTSRPTHYRVLMDENKIGVDELQALTYNFAYLYTKCTRSISHPPCVRYADQIALLDRYHYNAAARSGSDTASYIDSLSTPRATTEEEIRRYYTAVHKNLLTTSMYW